MDPIACPEPLWAAARWIGTDGAGDGTVRVERDFHVRGSVSAATLSYAALGMGYVWVNGQPVDDAVLHPPFTAYHRRTPLCVVDVTSRVVGGRNRVAAEIGNGFYNVRSRTVWRWHEAVWRGPPRFLAALHLVYEDGRSDHLVTDSQWTIRPTCTTFNDVYAGETFDARITPETSAGRPAPLLSPPSSGPEVVDVEPIRITGSVDPVSVTRLQNGAILADFGCVLAGWVNCGFQASRGTCLSIRYAEKLAADGQVDQGIHLPHLPDGRGRLQCDEYVCAGQGLERWEPRFSYKGFRYVQVEARGQGWRLESIVARRVHSDLVRTGRVVASEPLLGAIVEATARTILNNTHGIPTDTPMYEKNGWTGDAALMSESFHLLYDCRRFLAKRIRDLMDCVADDGALPVIVPASPGTWGWLHAPPWTVELPEQMWNHYLHWGDAALLAEAYPSLQSHLEYQQRHLVGGLASSEFGDWCPPGVAGQAPEGNELAATAFVHRHFVLGRRIARTLGDDAAAARYAAVAQAVRTAFNARFLDERGSCYRIRPGQPYRQTNAILPLAFDLCPTESRAPVLAGLVADIRRCGDHLDTGILGTKYLLPVLTEGGELDLAYRVATQRTCPSWGYWLARGATTLWERWETTARSRDHFMFGTIVDWIFKYLAGIHIDVPGGQHARVEPHFPQPLDSYAAGTRIAGREVHVSWRRAPGGVEMEVALDAGAEADVRAPDGTIQRISGPTLYRTSAGLDR